MYSVPSTVTEYWIPFFSTPAGRLTLATWVALTPAAVGVATAPLTVPVELTRLKALTPETVKAWLLLTAVSVRVRVVASISARTSPSCVELAAL